MPPFNLVDICGIGPLSLCLLDNVRRFACCHQLINYTTMPTPEIIEETEARVG
jgi:hypothetical protein